ncbi:cytochrome P450 [Lasiosphaeria ovina]|uniref:Cytochrome P450 n=1 Tax=Lasiosphaeria ovina TaxID=92902 RepID=A0AAE0K8E3_9PEZI|nr:cytochrome P450 [Lasiosphaeria ovina]
MPSALLSLGPFYTIVLVFSCAAFYFAARRVYIDYKIRKTGGVRARVIATNPLWGLPFFVKAGYFQSNNRFLEFFQSLYAPESPNCVEISLTGASRWLITQEPEHIKTVLTTKFKEYGKGPAFHESWGPFLGDGIFNVDGQLWSDSRALLRPIFVRERVRDIEIFDKWTNALISKLPSSGQTVDVSALFYRMTLDVTTDFLLGHGVNSLENPTHEFAQAFHEVQKVQMILTIMAPFKHFIPKHSYFSGIRVLNRFIDPFVARTLALDPEELDKLSKSDRDSTLLHNIARYTRDPKMIRDHLMSVLLAGRDTTAATLSWAIYELANYPAVYGKLRNEVLATVGTSRAPTYDDLKSMTYLTHTMHEVLRLYPAVPFNIRAALQDTSLPPAEPGQPPIAVLKGDAVIYSAIAMQRRPELYPEISDKFANPATFSPDRWNHWTPKPWQYLPFNGGPRICVGQNFAMTEMAFTLVRLLQKYDRLEYRGDWKAQIYKAEIIGAPGHGVPVALFEAAYGDDA